jgi:hypothetical protein
MPPANAPAAQSKGWRLAGRGCDPVVGCGFTGLLRRKDVYAEVQEPSFSSARPLLNQMEHALQVVSLREQIHQVRLLDAITCA